MLARHAADTADCSTGSSSFGVRGLRVAASPSPRTRPVFVCPIDGSADCRRLDEARQWVADRLRDHPALPGNRLVPGEVTDTGRVTDERARHVIAVCEEQGVDWRQGATVRLGWATAPCYDVVRSEPYPDPQIPRPEPPQPQPSVQTPRHVRRWFDEQVAAGQVAVTPLTALPRPEVRRQLRERAGLSRPAVTDRQRVPSPKRASHYESFLT